MRYYCKKCWNKDKKVLEAVEGESDWYYCPECGIRSVWGLYTKRDFKELISIMEKELAELKKFFSSG